ncbi:uncharacterized protein ACJ7VT_018813 [Polymixia lowei]
MSSINVSLDNPYGHVTIPRAKLRHHDNNNGIHDDGSMVIANPAALVNAGHSSYGNPYGADLSHLGEGRGGVAQAAPPPPYMVKEDKEEVGRCRACCYRCRRK